MTDVVLFGFGALLGIVPSILMIFREARIARLLKKYRVDGTQQLLVSSSLGLQLLLGLVQVLYLAISITALVVPRPRPDNITNALTIGLIASSWIIGLTSVVVYRTRVKIENNVVMKGV